MVPIDDDIRAEMLAAADAVSSNRIDARVSYLRRIISDPRVPKFRIEAGGKFGSLRCSPSPCVELWVVPDSEISSDWEVAE